MKLPNVSNVFSKFTSILKTNSPAILTGTAIIGVVGTFVLTAYGTSKTMKELYDMESKDLESKEKAKIIAKNFIPPVSSAVGSVLSIIFCNAEHAKKYAALMSAYSLSQSQLNDHKNKIAELLGDKEAEKIETNMTKEYMSPVQSVRSDEKTLIKDLVTGMEFESSILEVTKAVNDINSLIAMEGSASISSFYEILGLEAPELADEKGWSIRNTHPIFEIEWDAKLRSDGKVYLTIRYDTTTLW